MKLFSLLFAGLALAKEELTGAEFKAEVAKGPVFAKFYAKTELFSKLCFPRGWVDLLY